MDANQILAELRDERSRIDRAIAAIEGLNSRGRKRGRPPLRSTSIGRKHRLTPEGRKRISDMMKKRWAERRRKKAKAG